MEVSANDENVKIPDRKLRKDFSAPLLEFKNKNIQSPYMKDYNSKTNLKDQEFYNIAKHSGFEDCYKEHLPTRLMSCDYKPFKVKLEDKIKEPAKIPTVPFFGRGSYSIAYPNWGAMSPGDSKRIVLPEIKIPLRGNSNYAENYIKYDPKFYEKRDPLNFSKATLEFYGKLNLDTIYKTSFVPIDFNQPHYFPKDKLKKSEYEKASFLPAEFSPSHFKSNYAAAFVDYNKDQKCKLVENCSKSRRKNFVI